MSPSAGSALERVRQRACDVSTNSKAWRATTSSIGNGLSTTGSGTKMSYLNATAAVTVDIAAGTADRQTTRSEHDTFSGVSYSSAARQFNDTLLGSNNDRSASRCSKASGGDDFINGRGGFDRAMYGLRQRRSRDGRHRRQPCGRERSTGDDSIGSDTLRSVEAIRATHFADRFDATGFGPGRRPSTSAAAAPSTISKGWAATISSSATAIPNLTILMRAAACPSISWPAQRLAMRRWATTPSPVCRRLSARCLPIRC